MNRIWNFFIDKYRLTYLIITSLLLLGMLSAISMPKESDPEVIVPVGVVSTVFPGASALDVEELITNEIEKEVESLDDLDKYSSTSAEGISSVVVEFDASSNIDDRIRALKDAVDDAIPELPDDAEIPVVRQVSLSDEPMMTMSLTAEVSESELKEIGETVQEELEKISGVSEVKVTGTRRREIQVTLDPVLVQRYELSLGDIVRAIRNNDAQLPVGSIEQNQTQYTVRLEGSLKDTAIIPWIPVTTKAGQPVFLKDIAEVTDGLETEQTLSRLSLGGEESKPSIGIEIFKRDGSDIGVIDDEARRVIDEFKETILADAEVFISFSMGERIQDDLSKLLFNGMQTVIIVFLLLLLFLGRKEAALAGISIPMTFFITFIVLSYLGFTLNFLTLFSLILALGILVDATIVIVEGMHFQLKKGQTAVQAAKMTIVEFQWPVISGIFTTVSAFFPMMFASGVTGQFIRTIPVTVSIVLIASLFVALTVTPMLGSRFLKPIPKPAEGEKKKLCAEDFIDRLGDWYQIQMEKFLRNRKQQKRFMAILTALFFVSMSLPFVGIVDAILFPSSDEDRFFINLEAPIGTAVSKTDAITSEVEAVLYEDKRVVSFVTNVGSAGGQTNRIGGGGAATNGHLARFSVNLVEEGERKESKLIVEEYREKLKAISGATISVTQLGAGPPQGAPIEITLTGEDMTVLDKSVRDAEQLLASIEGVTEIERSIKDTPFEFVFTVNRPKAAQVGVSPLDVAQYLRTALFGQEAVELTLNGDDVKVMVQMNLNRASKDPHQTHQASINAIEHLDMVTPTGSSIPLRGLVETNLRSSSDTIRHEEGDRIAKLTAYLKPDFTTQGVLEIFQERLPELEIPKGYDVRYGGEAEDVQESFTDMYKAMIIGVFLIACILVLQFNSFRQPFFILSSLPFAMIGVMPGLAISGQPLSFPAFIGIVALVGIVVNDAIILIDQVNQNRRQGMERLQAVVEGSHSRLQPIILTTITTVAGILPITLSDAIWGPLGFTIIFGLTFATVLTLIIVPLLYFRYAEKVVPR